MTTRESFANINVWNYNVQPCIGFLKLVSAEQTITMSSSCGITLLGISFARTFNILAV